MCEKLKEEGFAEGDLGSDNDVPNMLDCKKLVTKGKTDLLTRLCLSVNHQPNIVLKSDNHIS